MCGITGIHFKNPRDPGVAGDNLERLVDELLLGIEHRGTHATGVLTVDAQGRPNLCKADLAASQFIKWRDTMPRRVRTILGHTRFATQGEPTNLDNNHPVQYGSCFAIHNGHISNDSELFNQFSLDRQAEVDSEIIPALLNMTGLDKARDALELLDGNYAVAAVDPERFPNTTILAKGWSSPVEVYENHYAVMWASTKDTILNAIEEVFGLRLASGEIKSLSLGEMLVMNGAEIEKLKFKPLTKSWSRSSSSSSTTTYSYRYGWHDVEEDTEDSLQDKCVSCGCERLYHGSGVDFSGACTYVQAGSNFRCRCLAFKTESRLAIEFCDGCGREFYIGDLIKIGRKYLCPNVCAKDPALNGYILPKAGKTLRDRAEDVIARQLAAAEEFGVPEWDEEAWAAREEAFNEHVCNMASEKTGQAADYIDWLVNRMDKELAEVDESGYLNEAKRVAGKAYFTAWYDLNSEVEEVDSVRWSSGNVYVPDNDSDTESRACPHGKESCLGEDPYLCEDCAAEESCGVIISMTEEVIA